MEISMGLTKEQRKKKKLKKLEQRLVKAEDKISLKGRRKDWSQERWRQARGIEDIEVVPDYDAPMKSDAKEGESMWPNKSIVHRTKPKNLKLRRIEKKIAKVKGEDPVWKEGEELKKKKRRFKLKKKKLEY